VPYCVPARGLSGRRILAAGWHLIKFIHKSEALAPWYPPIAPKMAPFLRAR